MKKYNKKILNTTKKIKDKTYTNAMSLANEATHPSQQVAHTGAIISGGVGVILLIAGVVGLLLKKDKWGWGFLCTGMIVVIANIINLIRIVSKRND